MDKKLPSNTQIGKVIMPLFLWIAFITCIPTLVFSDDIKIHPDAGKTSAAFLKIGAGARAAAMAGAFSGIADDATAIYWNPAGLLQSEEGTLQINASHNEWFESIRHDFVGFSYKKKNSPIAFGGAFYGLYTQPDIERRTGGISETDPFEPLTSVEGYFGAYDIALSFGAAYQIKKSLLLGGSIKLINQTIDNYSGFAGAVDIGSIYKPENISLPLTFAAVIQNVGTPLKLDQKSYPLPFNIRLAASYRRAKANHPFNLSFETAFPIDNYPFFYLGGEYFVAKIFALRGGYRYRLYGLELGDLNGFTAGAGIKLPITDKYEVSLDYAFNPYGVLGNSHRISASIKFGPSSTAPSVLESSYSSKKMQHNNKLPGALTTPVLPTPPVSQTPKISGEEKENIFYLPTKIVFTPKIVSNISALAEFSATPITDGNNATPITKVNGMLKTRSLPPHNKAEGDNTYYATETLLLEIGSQTIKDNTSQEKLGLFFRTQNFIGRMENLTISLSIPSDKKIKSVSSIPVNQTAAKPLPLPFELKSTDGKTSYYEIKSPTLTDIIVEFSQK